jgi:hypothetical protein
MKEREIEMPQSPQLGLESRWLTVARVLLAAVVFFGLAMMLRARGW